MSDHGTPERFNEGCKCPACKYAGRYPAVKERQRAAARRVDERVAIPLDPELALQAILRVDPKSEPVTDDPALEFFGMAGNKW